MHISVLLLLVGISSCGQIYKEIILDNQSAYTLHLEMYKKYRFGQPKLIDSITLFKYSKGAIITFYDLKSIDKTCTRVSDSFAIEVVGNPLMRVVKDLKSEDSYRRDIKGHPANSRTIICSATIIDNDVQ